ncbi:hypothetical protein M0805_008277 [Coniferiporia weirii]|nr:hypothetical protein M0805_008277 [Coniferiporia weirii]
MPSKSDQIRKAAANVNTLFIGAVDDRWQMFSDEPDDYSIGRPIGFGASSIVYAARYMPKDGSPCAVKVVDLDKLPPQSLRLLRRETQLMSLSKHPNVLRVRGSWVAGHKLHIALRLMNSGSVADVMRYGWPGGMEEEVVKCILKQALEGLNYLHINGFIHRDIKAANLLVDDDGTVLLGDLGVAASLSDEESTPSPSGSGPRVNFDTASGDHPRLPTSRLPPKKLGKRKSFVGTPCWMAPELISGKQYDAKADIWSFGITAIELTQGRAPRSREAPARVLLKTVQEEPPLFARESGSNKFSKAFKDIVESCLVKDPSNRPSAAELLESPFFKSAKRKGYLIGAILKDLPPLVDRQERRLVSAQPLNAASRSSMSSWDFSMELPRTPTASTHASHSFFGAGHSHHAHQSHHHSLTVSKNTSNTSRLDALEENAFADVFTQLKLAQPSLCDSHDDDDNCTVSSSSESSVFDLSESDPTTSEAAFSSLPSSSTATTPLSCSSATALDIPLAHADSRNDRSNSRSEKGISGPPATLQPQPKSTRPSLGKTLAQKVVQPAHMRRGSLPATGQARPDFSASPSRKRVMSVSGRPPTQASASPSSTLPSQTPNAEPNATDAASGRWWKLVRKNSSPKIGGDGSISALGVKESERKRGTLGRILERTAK